MSHLEVRGLTVAFNGTPVLDDVWLDVPDGTVTALLGASGSGKSTLFRAIAGILVPDAGAVLLDGRDVTEVPTHRRGIGLVFQDNQLFPHRTVAENVEFGLKMAGRTRDERRAASSAWLERVGMAGFERRRVTDLSGGEAKRVALARTMVTEPAVVLLDEPLTGLDRELHDRLAVELREILSSADVTAVLVTHDADEAAVVADRIEQITALSRRGAR